MCAYASRDAVPLTPRQCSLLHAATLRRRAIFPDALRDNGTIFPRFHVASWLRIAQHGTRARRSFLSQGPNDGRRFTRSASRLAMRNADVTSEAQFATTVRIRSSIDVISD